MTIDEQKLGTVKAARARDWNNVAQLMPSLQSEAIFAVTATAAGPLLDAVRAAPGTRLLDVAMGPGLLVPISRARGCEHVGLDFAPAMVEAARGRFPDLTAVVGDAEHLEFPDGSFDAVICNFGINGFPNPDRALAEARRVLVPGGHHAFTTWCEREHNELFRIAREATARHVDIPPDAGQKRAWTRDECRVLFDGAGFTSFEAEVIRLIARPRSPEEVLELVYTTGRLLRLITAQEEAVRRRIEQSIVEAARDHDTGNGIELALPVMLARGTRPAT